MHPDLVKAAKQLDVSLPGLERAAKHSEQVIDHYKTVLPEFLKNTKPAISSVELEHADIVLLGSIARQESTPTSDCDYYILEDGARPATARGLRFAAESIRQEIDVEQLGARGAFGEIVVAGNLYERIGLEVDSNVNLTQRTPERLWASKLTLCNSTRQLQRLKKPSTLGFTDGVTARLTCQP